MMDEQKLADIRARCKAEAYVVVSHNDLGERYEDECWQAIEDVATLLRMIDQQQAVIDAAGRVRARVEHETRKYGTDHVIDSSTEWGDMCDALDALNRTEPDAAGLSADKTDSLGSTRTPRN